jgi:cell division protein FtsI/penicillin-binding protein 2
VGEHSGSAGTPVQTTLDPTVQQAAEAALNTAPPSPASAMVVVRAATGAILASVSRSSTTAFDTALGGALPPGSTFKVITSAALLQHGDSPSMTASCPSTVTVNGQVFHNAEPEAQTTLTFAHAFAVSCNTAFITMVQQAGLTGVDLAQAGAMFGLETTPRMGLPAFGGHVPAPAAANDLAATAIGQGKVTASPLAMAEVAAAVDSGSVHLPRLVAGAPDDTATPLGLNPYVVSQLRSMMAGVVTADGTAAGAGLPAGTYGKTGTAEYQRAVQSTNNAWFIGFRGDLAFAVVLEGVPSGQLGGAVAAPLAARLLNAIPANV